MAAAVIKTEYVILNIQNELSAYWLSNFHDQNCVDSRRLRFFQVGTNLCGSFMHASINPLNNGCEQLGLLWNSGWNWHAI